MEHDQTIAPSTVIDRLGGTTATSKLCGVTPSAVSQWRENGIPRPWLLYLRAKRPKAFAQAKQPEQDKNA